MVNLKQHQFYTNLLLSLLVALFLAAIFYPNYWFTPSISFFDSDHYVDFLGSFILTNFFYQGGIQLWDSYDQMPLAYLCITDGIYKLPNILTALSYAILSPFSDNHAQLFSAVFSFVHFFSLLLIRLIGCYLLLERFCQHRWLLILSTAYLSTVLSPYYFLVGLPYQSFYPLFLHLILKIVEENKIKYLFLTFLFFAVCFSYGVLQGGYLYQGIHMFIIPTLIWAWSQGRLYLIDVKKSSLIVFLLILLGAFIIMLPDLYMVKFCLSDFSFGYKDSRITNVWSISNYFNQPNIAFAHAPDFLWRSVDFTNKDYWGEGWAFVGYWVLALALFGAIFGKDSRRHIFTSAIILIWALNNPKDSFPFGLIAHWLNALTNVVKFIPRSIHLASVMILYFLLAPLVVLGIQALWDNIKSGQLFQREKIKCVVFASLILLMSITMCRQLPAITPYVLFCLSLLTSCLILTSININGRLKLILACILIALLFAVDTCLMVYYVRQGSKPDVHPHAIINKPELGTIGVDFQNPRILPFRSFYDLYNYNGENHYLITSKFNMPGLLFRYNNMMRNFYWTNNYMPRHISYSSWQQDPLMGNYISTHRELMFFASHAVNASDNNFKEILTRNLQHDVVMLEDASLSANMLTQLQPSPAIDAPLNNLIFLSTDALQRKHKDLLLLRFKLPDNFPNHLASTFLTMDNAHLQLIIPENPQQIFSNTQGQIVSPFTFDINNVQEGYLTIGLPANFNPHAMTFKLIYPAVTSIPRITAITTNQSDKLGFNYLASQDGWLVFHTPYDTKWQATIDNNKTPLMKANKSFMAIPLTKGPHAIDLEYWPNSPLRWMILLSIILASIDFILLMYFILRRD